MFGSSKQKEQSSMCPLCGSQTKHCLLMPIKEAVDLPLAEIRSNLEKAIAFFQEDSSETLRALSSQQSGFDKRVCIACVHLLNSCVLFSTRKIQNGVFQVSSSPQKDISPEQEVLNSRFESRKRNKPIEIVLPQEKEPEGPMIFLNRIQSYSSLSSRFKSSPKSKTLPTLHSEDLKRIFSTSSPAASTVTSQEQSVSDKTQNETTSKVGQRLESTITSNLKTTLASPKPSESSPQANVLNSSGKVVSSPKDTVLSSKPFESSAEASVPSPRATVLKLTPKPQDTVSSGEVNKERPWGKQSAANQPMLANFSKSGEEKQQVFMHSLDLCKHAQSLSPDSKLSTSTPRANQTDNSKATQESDLSSSPKSRSCLQSSPRMAASPQSAFTLTTSPKSNPNASPRKSPLISCPSSRSSPQRISLCKNLSSSFDSVAEPKKDCTSDASTLSLLERVMKVTQQKSRMPPTASKPPARYFNFTCKTTPDPVEDNEAALSSIISSLNSSRARCGYERNQSLVPKLILPEEEPETAAKVDVVLKPIKFTKSPTKPVPFMPNLPDLSNIKAAASQTPQKQDKQSNETENSLTSILKKPKSFILGAKKPIVKRVTFNSDPFIKYFDSDDKSQDSNSNSTEREKSESNTQNFSATISVQSNSSSLQLNFTSEDCSSNISLNLERKSPSGDGKTSPKKSKLIKDGSSVGESACKSQDKSNTSVESPSKVKVRQESACFANDSKNSTPEKLKEKYQRRLSDVKSTPELKKHMLKKKLNVDDRQLSPKKIKLTESNSPAKYSASAEHNKCITKVTPENDKIKSDSKNKSFHPVETNECYSKRLSEAKGTPDLKKSKTKNQKLNLSKVEETSNLAPKNNVFDKNAASEQFLKDIGLIDNDDINSHEETSVLAPLLENDTEFQAISDTVSCSDPISTATCSDGLPVQEIKKKRRGRPASKKIKNSSVSTTIDKLVDIISEAETQNKKIEVWKPKYIADQVVENESEFSNEELINAQKELMSCFVYLTRCDENKNSAHLAATSDPSSSSADNQHFQRASSLKVEKKKKD